MDIEIIILGIKMRMKANLRDTPKNLLKSSKRIVKKELGEQKLMRDIASEKKRLVGNGRFVF